MKHGFAKESSPQTKTIQAPNQFFFRLAPVIASINEGHLRLRSVPKRYSKSEEKEFKKKKPLFALMDYKIIDDRIFVKENKENVIDKRIIVNMTTRDKPGQASQGDLGQ